MVAVIDLYLVPHTHADVGWMQTVNSLFRMNISRILDSVTDALVTDRRRRFVWDEMAFLQMWWDLQATPARKAHFKQHVLDRRIELVDNGWSQHDMGCTTLDSMLNNWVEGHEWIRQHFGPEYEPRVGWSLDPFGPSSTQAVLQAYMGMDAWFFTRISSDAVDNMKKERGLEFVWRASSSLPDNESEIFAHVFESYYCMPGDYAFEWNPSTVPNVTTLYNKSRDLAELAKARAKWFRTPNVLIPWGCDYTYQDAHTSYVATDQLLETINANTALWGVRAHYATASEYVDAVMNSTRRHMPGSASLFSRVGEDTALGNALGTIFPVKANGSTFFPYRSNSDNGPQDWSGYFTSRPTLKLLSSQAHSALSTAETLFALHGRALADSKRITLWQTLEQARRAAAIFQHHDAITGTFCVSEEGCVGGLGGGAAPLRTLALGIYFANPTVILTSCSYPVTAEDQDVGSHDLLGDYRQMLTSSLEKSHRVIVAVLPAAISNSDEAQPSTDGVPVENFSTDPTVLGDLLMGNGDGGDKALLVAFNPLAHRITEVITVPSPVCAVQVADAQTGLAVPSQTTAALLVNPGEHPYYDFELAFVVTLPALGSKQFYLTPVHSVPPPNETSSRSPPSHLLGHTRGWACPATAGGLGAVHHVQVHGERSPRCENPAEPPCVDRPSAAPPPSPPSPLYLENKYIRLTIDPRFGLQSLYDKRANRTYGLSHSLIEYRMSKASLAGAGPAYLMAVEGAGTPLLGGTRYPAGSLTCRAWRQTSGCDADGEREPSNDVGCMELVGPGNVSGYCECAHSIGLEEWEPIRLGLRSCKPAPRIRCADVCAASGAVTREAVAATVALGPVTHEAWVQINAEHRERIRIWQTDDPVLGARVDIGSKLGILSPMTEIASRFTLVESEVSSRTTFYSEVPL